MEFYRQRTQGHPLHATLKDLEKQITNGNDIPRDSLPLRDGYARFLYAFRSIKRLLGAMDPILATSGALDRINQSLVQLKTVHGMFSADGNWKELNLRVDAVLEAIRKEGLTPAPSTAQDFHEILEEFRKDAQKGLADIEEVRKTLHKHLEGLDQQQKEIANALEGHKQDIQAQKQRVDALISGQSTDFANQEKARADEFAKQEQARTAAITKGEEERRKQLEHFKGEYQMALENALETQRQQVEVLLKNQQTTSDLLIGNIEKQLKEAEKIVGIIGNTGKAGHYQQVANEEKKAANRLRAYALFFFVFMIFTLGIITFEVFMDLDSFNWQVGLFRIGVVFALLAPAYYCARESAKHRMVEQRNRRLELEFAAIDPYLKSLDKAHAQEIIKTLAVRYFGNEVSENDDGLSKISGKDAIKLLERLLKTVRDVRPR